MRQKEKKTAETPKLSHSRLELIGGGKRRILRMEGVKKILLCREDCVKASLAHETITVEGRALLCLTYMTGAVEVSGVILSLSFSEGGRQEA